MYPSL